MRRLYEIAANTFLETVRNHILYLVLFFALALIVLSVFFADWSVFARAQVMQDFGLATMSIAGLLLAVFIGVGLLSKEMSQKTLYHVITKPVSRSVFVCGKFLGLFSTIGAAPLPSCPSCSWQRFTGSAEPSTDRSCWP